MSASGCRVRAQAPPRLSPAIAIRAPLLIPFGPVSVTPSTNWRCRTTKAPVTGSATKGRVPHVGRGRGGPARALAADHGRARDPAPPSRHGPARRATMGAKSPTATGGMASRVGRHRRLRPCPQQGCSSVQVDYREMLAALKEVGYDWYWCFEVGRDRAREAIADFRHIQ